LILIIFQIHFSPIRQNGYHRGHVNRIINYFSWKFQYDG
jgi:hypothetical protein